MRIKSGPLFRAIQRDGSVGTAPITSVSREDVQTDHEAPRLDATASSDIGGHPARIGAAYSLATAGAAPILDHGRRWTKKPGSARPERAEARRATWRAAELAYASMDFRIASRASRAIEPTAMSGMCTPAEG